MVRNLSSLISKSVKNPNFVESKGKIEFLAFPVEIIPMHESISNFIPLKIESYNRKRS